MKSVSFVAAVAAAVVAVGAFVGLGVVSAGAQSAPGGIIVINIDRLRAESVAFRDMGTKVRNLANEKNALFNTANQGERQQIEAAGRALLPQLQGKSQQEIAANPSLQSQVQQQAQREEAFNAKTQRQQASLQVTAACAEQAFGRALDPIVDQIMAQRNASIVLPDAAVLKTRPLADATQDAINALNAATQTVNVVWVEVQEGQQPQCPN